MNIVPSTKGLRSWIAGYILSRDWKSSETQSVRQQEFIIQLTRMMIVANFLIVNVLILLDGTDSILALKMVTIELAHSIRWGLWS